MSARRCFRVHQRDNVATALDDLAPGQVEVLGAAAETAIAATEDIQLGHKIALQRIGEGEAILKFGVPIGIATTVIQPGSWVHLHNCRSKVDERSSHLDLKTGAALDTAYA
jgi:hypothetical protein